MSRSLFIKLGFDLKAFSTSSQNISRSLKKTGKEMQSIGKSMSMSVTAPIVAMGGLAVKVFADFEQSMAKVQAVSGATGAEFEKLNKLAKDLGISTRFTATEVSDLMLNYSKLGFSSEEIQQITESTLDLALATGEDLATSAEIAGATLRGFGLEAGEMKSVIDVMAKSFSSSALNLERFGTAMAVLAPVAKNANVSLEQATGFLSILTDRGVDASTAGTGLRNIFLDLAGSGQTLESAMSEIANSTNKNKTAFDMFGKRGATVAAIMADNSEEARVLTEAYKNSAGAAAKMAAIMDDTTTGSLMKLKSAAEGLGISFGDILSPYVKRAAQFVADLAIGFSELTPETKKIIVVVAALAAGIGPLIFIIGSLTVALGFLAAHPIVLIITGIIVVIGLLAAAFIYVRNNFEQFADFFYNLWVTLANNTIEEIKSIVAPFLYLTKLMGRPIEGGVNGYLDSFKLTARTAKKEFKTLGEVAQETKDKIKDALNVDANSEISITPKVNVKKGISEAIGGLKSKKIDIPFSISANIPQVEQEFLELATVSENAAKRIGEGISEALTSGLERMVIQSAQLMGEFVGNMITGSDKAARQDFGAAFLGMIGGFMQEFGAAMIGIGIAQSAIATAISAGPLGAPLAIAGGIALIAAGAVLSNVSRKGVDTSGGDNNISNAPAPSYSSLGQNYSMNTIVKINGRDLILVQEREMAFRR